MKNSPLVYRVLDMSRASICIRDLNGLGFRGLELLGSDTYICRTIVCADALNQPWLKSCVTCGSCTKDGSIVLSPTRKQCTPKVKNSPFGKE